MIELATSDNMHADSMPAIATSAQDVELRKRAASESAATR